MPVGDKLSQKSLKFKTLQPQAQLLIKRCRQMTKNMSLRLLTPIFLSTTSRAIHLLIRSLTLLQEFWMIVGRNSKNYPKILRELHLFVKIPTSLIK